MYTGQNRSLNGQQQPVPKVSSAQYVVLCALVVSHIHCKDTLSAVQWSGQDGLNDQPDVFPTSDSITLKPASGAVAM